MSDSGPCFLPEAESTHKGVVIVTGTTTWGQLFQVLYVTSSEHDIIRFECGNKTLHDIGNKTPPFPFPVLLQSPDTDVVLEGGFFVGQVAKLHRLENAIYDHGGTKAGSQSQE